MIRIAGMISGAEIYNLNLIKGFKMFSKLKLSYITNNKEFKERIESLNTEAVVLKTIKEIGTKKDLLKAFLIHPYLITTYIKKIKELEKEEIFDLICLQSMTEKIFLTPFLKILNYKIVWLEHGPLFKTRRAKVIKILYKVICNFTNKIITVSKDTEKDLVSGGINKNKIETVYIGVNIEYFAPLSKKEIENEKQRLRIPQEDFIVGFLGSINREKGIEEFICVAGEILKLFGNTTFLIIGDGPLLKNMRERNKNKNFIFSGFIEDVKKHIGIMNILFFPTKHHEGISISLLEAMSMGVPVFANDIGGNNELVKNNKTGQLYQVNKYKAAQLARKILEFLNSDKRQEIGKNARDSVIKDFNINKNVKIFYDLFVKLKDSHVKLRMIQVDNIKA